MEYFIFTPTNSQCTQQQKPENHTATLEAQNRKLQNYFRLHIFIMFRFHPGCEHRARVRCMWRRWGRGGGERGGEEQHKGSTLKRKQEHDEDELLLPAGLVFSFWSGEQPWHKLGTSLQSMTFVQDSITIISYIYFYVCFFTSIYFLRLLSQRAQLLNMGLKKQLEHNCLTRTVTVDLLLWTLSKCLLLPAGSNVVCVYVCVCRGGGGPYAGTSLLMLCTTS